MKALDYIVGFSRYEQELDPRLWSLTLESQRVRVYQSQKALWLVIIGCAVSLRGLWSDVDSVRLLSWVALVVSTASVRMMICRHVEERLETATVPVLYRNECLLFFSSLLSTAAVGSGFWWVCLDGSVRAIFAITLLSLIYAIGTIINSSVHYRGLPLFIVANLGQGVVFLLWFRSPAEIEAAVAMIGLIVLLVHFARRNAEVFKKSVRIRDENREQNIKLEKDKLIIEKALNVARKANEEKNRFLAAASHDLRQPLHAMTLFLGSLRHMANEDRMRELIDKIDETSTLLHEQFNSLLDLSKFDAGVVTADETNFRLDMLLKNLADAARQEAQQKKIALHLYTVPATVHSDMLLMERMLRNLVVNALRYTDEGSVSIQLRHQSQGLMISIIDTGVGIAPEEQQRIFSDYYQVSNKARSKGKGAGLGLAIVKRIAALLDMTVSLKSTPGEGCTFSVFVPARAVVPTAGDEETGSPDNDVEEADLQGLDVLVVDDDPSVLEAVTGLMQTWGCHAVGAASPEQVKRLMASDSGFDLILMDDMLDDDVSGLELARELAEKLPSQRIIMATGNVDGSRLAEIREAGFEVLTKPVDCQLLRHTMADALRDRQAA